MEWGVEYGTTSQTHTYPNIYYTCMLHMFTTYNILIS